MIKYDFFKVETLSKCHETMDKVAKDHVRKLRHGETEVDKKLNKTL